MKRGAENTWPSPDLRPRPSHGPATRRRWPSTFKLIQTKSMTLETRAPPAAPPARQPDTPTPGWPPPPQAALPTRSAPSPRKGGGLPLALLPQSETAKRGQRDWARTPPTAPAHRHTRGRPSPALTPARSRTTCPLSADGASRTDGRTHAVRDTHSRSHCVQTVQLPQTGAHEALQRSEREARGSGQMATNAFSHCNHIHRTIPTTLPAFCEKSQYLFKTTS